MGWMASSRSWSAIVGSAKGPFWGLLVSLNVESYREAASCRRMIVEERCTRSSSEVDGTRLPLFK